MGNDNAHKLTDRVLAAMNEFTYFHELDEKSKENCARFAKIKEYNKDETIVGDDSGLLNWVHFVLKGNCILIEHIFVEVDGKDNYRIYSKNDLEIEGENENSIKKIASIVQTSLKRGLNKLKGESKRNSVSSAECCDKQSRLESKSIRKSKRKKDPQKCNPPNNKAKKLTNSTAKITTPNQRLNKETNSKTSHKLTTIFLKVCTYSERACFCLGENLERRRIIAQDKVVCLLIPRFCILQANNKMTWQRVLRFLNNHLPTTNELFKMFILRRKWRSYKTDFFSKYVEHINCNNINNVPISIRIRNDYDFK